jgi:hypothetical protein
MNGPLISGQPELVWNKGIAALCDRRIPDEFPDGVAYSRVSKLAGAMPSRRLPDNLISDPAAYRDIRHGELIWVRLSWLKSFVKQVLPLVKSRFVLVTGDSDACVPSEVKAEAQVILCSENVVHWYTQNYDGSIGAERISFLPIGIDFHMQSETAYWGEDPSSPLQQEQTIKSIRRRLPPRKNRIQKIYVDFAWQQGFGLRNYRRYHPLKGTNFRESRRRIVKMMLKNEAAFCQRHWLCRTEMWRRRGEYAFVLSPHGTGLDCHRTWEALALGHIVIVPSSSLDPLYTGLPVVRVKNWSELSAENLERWMSLYRDSDGTNERLMSRVWIKRMRSSAGTENAVLLDAVTGTTAGLSAVTS